MASDCLRTGPEWDLDPQDKLADDNEEPKLAQQAALDLLNGQRGEYPLDLTFYLDHLGYRGRKAGPVETRDFGRQIVQLLSTIPNLSNLSLVRSEIEGQIADFRIEGRWRSFRTSAQVLIGRATSGIPGQNSAARYYHRIRSH